MQYLKSEYESKYSTRWRANFALTSNGAMSEKMAQKVMENFAHITVSYLLKAMKNLNSKYVIEYYNSRDGPASKTTMSINVMFHAQHFDECKDLCEWLDGYEIKYVPRVIGEEPDSRESFAPVYNDEQLDYMKNFWKNKNAKLNNEKETTSRLSATSNLHKNNLDKSKLRKNLGIKKIAKL